MAKCFGRPCDHHQANFTNRVPSMRIQSGIPQIKKNTVQPFTESDDTRCCDNTICPPENGHVDARNMSRIVM